jgi:hypothetical protein
MNAPSPASTSPGSPARRSPHQAAASIRFNLNWQWTAIKLQYDRLVNNVMVPNDLIEVSMRKHMNGVVDMDFFVIAVHRLIVVAEQAKNSGCDLNKELKPAIKDFKSRWGNIAAARNALEHIDDQRPERALLPTSSSSGDWQLGMPGNSLKVHEIFRDAQILARTVSKVIEPYEPQQSASQAD